ncbi:MAG TPA: DUF6297 family protein [Actinomycetales bacterium]|nr:DUF6297 family protein [Actinomycetales bacterium]
MTARPSPAPATPSLPTASVPSARRLRQALRRARRRSGAAKPLGETLQDVYVTLFALAMLVAVAGPSAARVLRDVEGRAATTALAASLVTATLLAAAGAALGALLLVGPVVRDPADATWLLASPVRRRGLLAPPALLLVIAGAVAGVVVALAASVLVPRSSVLTWCLAGAAGGVVVVALAVVAQPRQRVRAVVRRCSTVLTAASLVVLVVGLAAGDRAPVTFPHGYGWLAGTGAVALVLLALVPASLDRLRRQELTAGAGLALGLRATVTALDGSFVAETLRARRLLERGLVRRRRLAARGWSALLVADARRVQRSWRSLAVPLALVPVAWMAARLYGDLAAVVAVVVVAWSAAGATAAGLRTVARSRGIARALPFTDLDLRAAYSVAPTATALLAGLVTAAVCGQPLWFAVPAASCALAGVLRTSAGRRPVKWELQAASPMGAMPVGAVMSYLVGIDVVAVTAVPLLLRLDPMLCLAVPLAAVLVLLRQRRRDD